MAHTINIRKFANYFSASTSRRSTVAAVPIVGNAVLDAVSGYERRHGGVWVGGVVDTVEGVFFDANALNRAIQSGPSKKHIRMSAIHSVRREFGWLTGIVVVEHAKGEFRFRCFGAESVARRLNAYLAVR